MADLAHFEGLDGGLAVEEPLFFCEPVPAPGPDPRLWPEEERQAAFVTYMSRTSPHITVRAVRNEGKRGLREQRQMKRTGLKAGTFDTFICWSIEDAAPDCPQTLVWIEWKGFSAKREPGKLTPAQIAFGNDMTRKGQKVACFYTVKPALEWLLSLGCPISGRVSA